MESNGREPGQRAHRHTLVLGQLGILIYMGVAFTIPWLFNLQDPALQRGLSYSVLFICLMPIFLGGVYAAKKGVLETK